MWNEAENWRFVFINLQVHSPPYRASLLFELYKSQANGYYIQLFYKNSTDENLVPLNIPSCGQKCSIEQFRKVYETIIPVDSFEKECKLSMLSMTYEEVDFHGVDGGMNLFVNWVLSLWKQKCKLLLFIEDNFNRKAWTFWNSVWILQPLDLKH